MAEELQFQQKGETGVITFNRPEARNALTFDMYESLAKLCESVLDKSLDIRSLIITGAGDKRLLRVLILPLFEIFVAKKMH